jgi:hypothetical protein
MAHERTVVVWQGQVLLGQRHDPRDAADALERPRATDPVAS